MTEPNWTQIAKFDVSAKPVDGAVWQCACPYVEGPGLLKIEAKGGWKYSTTEPCPPNGDLGSALDPKNCIHEKSAVGALIGRIGGSVADKDPISVFSVGALCVRKLDKEVGPLLLAINDSWTGFDDNEGTLEVVVFFAAYAVKTVSIT